MSPIASDDVITVTTATQSAADVMKTFGGDAPPAEPTAVAAAASTGDAAPASDEGAETRTSEVSDAARTLQANRLSERKKRMTDDIALYEDTIRRLGGTVDAFTPRGTYKKPQDELDEFARRRNDLLRSTNKILRERPAQAAPAARQPAASGDPTPAAAAAPKKFTFEKSDSWLAKHPEADYDDYMDARDDARDAFRATQETEAAQARDAAVTRDRQAQAIADAQGTFRTAEAEFRRDHDDYDTVLAAMVVENVHPKQVEMFQALILRAGKDGPKINYFLGKHPDETTRLFAAANPTEMLEAFGGVTYAALRAAGASTTEASAAVAATHSAAASAPPKPTSSAPAPIAPVRDGAQGTRTLAQVAADSEDADEYIAKRKAQQSRHVA